MKYYTLNDLHYGVRNNNPVLLKELVRVIDNFIDVLEKDDEVIILGDIIDNRNFISVKIMNILKTQFEKMAKRCSKIHIIYGNHDIHYKNTLFPNSIDPLLEHIENIHIYSEPTNIKIFHNDVLLVPWIVPSKEDEWAKVILESKANMCFGHFDIIGFQMNKTTKSKHGLEKKIFDKFDMVLSGHYHIASKQGNVIYLGTQTQHTWDDYGEVKKYHCFDENGFHAVNTDSETFVSAKYEDYEEVLQKSYTNKYVKFFIPNGYETKKVKEISEHLINSGAYDVSNIVEFNSNSTLETSNESVMNALSENVSLVDMIKEINEDITVEDENIDDQVLKNIVNGIIEDANDQMMIT